MPEKRHLLIHHFCQPNSVKVRMDSTQLIDGVTVCIKRNEPYFTKQCSILCLFPHKSIEFDPLSMRIVKFCLLYIALFGNTIQVIFGYYDNIVIILKHLVGKIL